MAGGEGARRLDHNFYFQTGPAERGKKVGELTPSKIESTVSMMDGDTVTQRAGCCPVSGPKVRFGLGQARKFDSALESLTSRPGQCEAGGEVIIMAG